MLHKAAFAALLALAAPSLAHAQPAATTATDPARLKEAQAIIAVMFPPDQRDAKLQAMLRSITGQMRGSLLGVTRIDDPGLDAILERFLDKVPETLMPTVRAHFPDILEATAVAYTHEFSLEELKQIDAFAQTPAGAHYFSKVTDLLSDPAVAAANQDYFNALHELQEKEMVDLRQEITTYLKEHPEVAKKLQAARP